ncbi:MAG: AAA family ATPase [Pseudomonadota bacterium]
MRRIMIIGGPGSGKSTLARRLAERTGLPHIHLDALYWEPGWRETDKARFIQAVRQRIAEDAWIIDGNYSATWRERADRADHVVFLDAPTAVRLARIVMRTLRCYGRSRPDLAPGCPERFTNDFLQYALGYAEQQRPAALALCAQPSVRDKAVIARNVDDAFAALVDAAGR